MFGDIYKNRRVMITGNTGFKGSWLSLWLQELGSEVVGFSVNVPTDPSHYQILNLDMKTFLGDVRDLESFEKTVTTVSPDIVFHLAAQSLLRRSYRNPVETFATNVMGTVNVLEACRRSASVKAVVVVTSDKCYEIKNNSGACREDDRLGGHDPYSASKACAELTLTAYQRSFFVPDDSLLAASVRAGNVIGGGDWSEDRLIPDIIRSITGHSELVIRYPEAVRPWQHVLDPLAGYLLLGSRLMENQRKYASSWNFGPEAEGERTVFDVLRTMKNHLDFNWIMESQPQPYETSLLRLNCIKAAEELNWSPVWPFNKAVLMTSEWYRAWLESETALSSTQLSEYIRDARDQRIGWAIDQS